MQSPKNSFVCLLSALGPKLMWEPVGGIAEGADLNQEGWLRLDGKTAREAGRHNQ